MRGPLRSTRSASPSARRRAWARTVRDARVHGPMLAALGLGAALVGCSGVVIIDEAAGGSSGVGSTETSSVTTGTAAPSTGAVTESACGTDSFPLYLWNGQRSGFVRCGDGAINRAEARACAPGTIPHACENPSALSSCKSSAECTERPNGRCAFEYGQLGGDTEICGCQYPCTTDADCDPGYACACADLLPGLLHNRCVPKNCDADADCASGECGLSRYDDGCARHFALSCRGPDDACHADVACASSGGECAPRSVGEPYACQTPDCALDR